MGAPGQVPRSQEPFPGIRWFAWVGVSGLCAAVAWSAMAPISDTDFGWHLAMGRHIVETRAVPASDPFTHTAPGAPEVAHEWLSQVVYALVDSAAGILGVRALHAGVAALLVLLVFLLQRRERVPAELALFGAFAYLVVAQGRFQTRPLLLDLLCLVLAYGWAFVLRPALTGRQLALAFAFLVVWANLHSGAVLFAGLAGLYAAVETVRQRVQGRVARERDGAVGQVGEPDGELGRGSLPRLWALAALAALACLATPNHWRLVPYVLETRRLNALYSDEWMPVTRWWGSPLMTPFALEAYGLLAAALVVALALGWRRQSLPRAAVVLALTALPLLAERFLCGAFAAVLVVTAGLARALEGGHRPRLRAAASVVAVLAVAAGAEPALNPNGRMGLWRDRLAPEWNFAPALFPINAVALLRETRLSARIYQPSAWGGYLLLEGGPDARVFVDGRWLTVGEKVLRDSFAIHERAPETWALLDRYGVSLLLLPREWMTEDVAAEHGWVTLFENYNSGLYLRAGPQAEADLRKVAAYYAERSVPFDPVAGFDERQVLQANPGWAKANRIGPEHFGVDGETIVRGW